MSLASAEIALRLARIGRIGPQHEAVVLDRGAAAGGGDEDGVEPLAVGLGDPGIDVAADGGERLVLAAHVVDDAAAAALALRQHHLDAVPGEHADGGLVDRRARSPA